MIIRTLAPWVNVSTVTIGVPKSCTSSRRSRLRGSDVLTKSTISALPCWRMSMPVELSDRSTTMRPFAVGAAPEVDVAQRVLDVAGPRLGEPLHDLRLGVQLLALVEQRHQHGVALDLRLERLRPVEVEDDARPVARLDHVDAAQRDVVDRALRGAEAVAGVEKVERDARRRRDREARGRIGRRRSSA